MVFKKLHGGQEDMSLGIHAGLQLACVPVSYNMELIKGSQQETILGSMPDDRSTTDVDRSCLPESPWKIACAKSGVWLMG